MKTAGKLLSSFPGPAVQISHAVFNDASFQENLALVLCNLNEEVLAAPTTRKAGSTVKEERGTAHPRYITQFVADTLLGLGQPANVKRICKRIGDEVLWKDAKGPWRR